MEYYHATRRVTSLARDSRGQNTRSVWRPTVDEPDGSHGDGEKAVLLHGNLDQDGREDEEDEDDDQAAGDAHLLRYPAHNNHVSLTRVTFYVIRLRRESTGK